MINKNNFNTDEDILLRRRGWVRVESAMEERVKMDNAPVQIDTKAVL